MSNWELFRETFLKPEMLAKYWPDILKGVMVTLEIAVAVVLTGFVLGLVLACVRAYRVRVLNGLIVVFVDIFRALPPLVAILLIYFGLRGALACAQFRADRLCRRDNLGWHHGNAKRAMGSRALNWSHFHPNASVGHPAASPADRRGAAD
jgi:His/Glu/Gln/Arg/opine family amino acid ABC transporter permease subunit